MKSPLEQTTIAFSPVPQLIAPALSMAGSSNRRSSPTAL